MNITILGSCRQYEFKNYFHVNSIQDRLTFPHYTKEIIQALQYCKGIHTFDNSLSQYCFRTGILERKQISYQPELQIEYENSDIVVVEIASRLSYEWNGVYVHHILTEPQYGFHDIQNIRIRDLTDDEIESDILTIQQLVFPKKLIVIPHVYTRTYGKRYDLVKLTEKICANYTIPFINPSEHLSHETNIYEENTAFHYTKKGNELIGKLYKSYTENLFAQKTVVFIWKQEYSNHPKSKYGNFWGLGDMLRGVIGMYQLSKKYGFTLLSDISYHPISQFLKQDRHQFSSNIRTKLNTVPFIYPDSVESSVQSFMNSNESVLFMATNLTPAVYNTPLSEECKAFIQYILRPTSDFSSYILSQIDNLTSKQYEIIHYRLGDDELLYANESNLSYDRAYSHLEKNYKDTMVLLCDSSNFKEYIRNKNPNLQLFNTKTCHIGTSNSYTAIRDTLFEFYLMAYSTKITSFSRLEWISGFVNTVHKIYDIPLEGHYNIKY